MDMIRGSLKNPVPRYMFAIAIILLGLIAFSDLAIDLFPDISLPIITVQTNTTERPEDIEISITRLVEKRVSRIQNVRYVSSQSREGVQMSPLSSIGGTDLNVASADIQQSLNQILDRLPEDSRATGHLQV